MNIVQRNVARLRTLLARTSLSGVSTHRALWWELPRLMASRAYNRLGSMAYALMDQCRLLDKPTKQSLDKIVDKEGLYFYVIVVPSVLHFLIPAVRLIQRHVSLLFVLNGVTASEKESLRKQFPDIPIINLWSFPKTVWPHGYLLSLLLRISKRDFGICDHDFFLFNPSGIDQLIFKDDEFAICATSWRNKPTGIEFPGTHFLYLRASLIREVMERYNIGAQLYKKVPRKIRPVLEEMGLSLNNPPKDYQSFFDSFLMLSSLAIHDGLRIRILDLSAEDWEHVGGTSIGAQITKSAVHHYTSCQFLELLSDAALSEEYKKRGLVTSDKAETLRKASNATIAARVDKLISKIRLQTEKCCDL